MKRLLAIATYIVGLAILICPAMPAFGQGTDLGSVRGVIADSSGAVIPNASIQIMDALTNTVRQTKSNASGNYEMFGLKSGQYTVTVAAPGMGTKVVSGVVLQGSDSVTVNVTLSVGATQQQVNVTDTAPIINTEDQTISQTISNKAILVCARAAVF